MVLSQLSTSLAYPADPPPNIVLFFVDNLGNGDIGCFGSKLHRTPHIDRLAAEGTKFTSFYVASGVCTPSRAALMTGCYPRRVNMHVSGTNTAVLRAVDSKGLHPDEMTIAEVLKPKGYATGIFGKWHLGDQPPFLPTRQGFDTFFGIPYSDDMTKDKFPATWPELPLLRNEKVIEAPVDRDYLVKRCTEEAIAFIEQNASRPFFCYIPHTMPGSTPTPFSSPAFRGKSKNGDYGDAVEELDWSTGEIVAALERLNLTNQTLVIWTSDNGAVARNPPQGTGAPYKGVGLRHVRSRHAHALRHEMARAAFPPAAPATKSSPRWTSCRRSPTSPAPHCPLNPSTATTFGRFWSGDQNAKSPWDEKGFMYYRLEQLQAVRSGPWKLYLPLTNKFVSNNRKTAPAKLELFNVRDDVSETREVSADHADVVRRLTALANTARADLGDIDLPGRAQRPAGHVPNPVPLLPPLPLPSPAR